MTFGLTTTGFQKKRLEDIRTEMEDAARLAFGNGINLRTGSVLGTLIGVFAEREALLWELAEAVYFSQYPNSAQGNSLDRLGAIIGITRLGATKSQQVGLLLFGTAGTVVPQGTQVSVVGAPTRQFVTQAPVTLVAGVNERQRIAFSAVPSAGFFVLRYRTQTTAQIAFGANAAAVQSALNALGLLSGIVVTGSFAAGFTVDFLGDDGLQPHEQLTVEQNTLTYVSGPSTLPVVVAITEQVAGVAQGTVDAIALATGPIAAPAYSLTVIDTPVTGLSRVVNRTDAAVGRDRETDAQYRTRYRQSGQRRAAGTVEAIRARLLDLAGVTSCIVFENRSQVTDLRGLPPKTFEAIVQGGDEQEIADLLWLVKPAGINPVGSVAKNVTDSRGFTQEIRFSRPALLQIYLDLFITRDVSTFPANGETLVREAVTNYINGLGLGKTVIVYPGLVSSLNAIPGIVDVVVEIGTSPNPTLDDNVVPLAEETPNLDSANLSVTLL